MRSGSWLAMVALVGLVTVAPRVEAGDEEYTLEFIPTQNAPPGAQASMLIKVKRDKPETEVIFKASGLYPDTVYTIWIVYNTLTWQPNDPNNASTPKVSSSSAAARPGFPREGNGVSPMAPMGAGFTAGMGWDPGASVVTNAHGKGQFQVKLDYDLIRSAPVSNKDVIVQCSPGPAEDGTCTGLTSLGIPRKSVRVTSAWLRRFVGEYALSDRAVHCANYSSMFDPEVQPDPAARKGMDARLWQCVDPSTVNPGTGEGLPRVHRYLFDHFRLANHPDDLTHGFIGGSDPDHWIDMVGRRQDLLPK
jgi:hypothetical protein